MIVEIVLIVFAVILWQVYTLRRPRGFPPGPPIFPVVGSLPYLYRENPKYHHLALNSLARKYGQVYSYGMGMHTNVCASGYDLVKEVMNNPACNGRPHSVILKARSLGKRLGIIFTDGPFWKTSRQFTLRHLKEFGLGRKGAEEVIREELVELLAEMKPNGGSSTRILHMNGYFNLSVLNVLWSMMAGVRYAHTDQTLLTLLTKVNDIFKYTVVKGGIVQALPFLRFIIPETCGFAPLMRAYGQVVDFLKDTIREHKETRCDQLDRDFIDVFLRQMDTSDARDAVFNDDALIMVCVDLFLAGSETTSTALTYAVLYMMQYPDVQVKVQKEIDQVIGRHRLPTLEDKKKLPYTEATITEMHRFSTMVPLALPHCTLEDTQIGGFQIPKGINVMLDIWSIHMDKAYWGDPETFRPERFLDASGNIVHNEHVIPFGTGKRSCLGEALARTSLFLYFTALMQNFTFHPVPGRHTNADDRRLGITLEPPLYDVTVALRD